MTRIRFPSVARRVGPGFAHARQTSIRDADVDALLELLGEAPQERHYLAVRLALTDRKARMVVEEARLRGHLVIWQRNDHGAGGLYRLAATREEFETWKHAEVASRLGSFTHQLREMDLTASRRWPVEQQRFAI